MPWYGNTATTDDHLCCIFASWCWFEGRSPGGLVAAASSAFLPVEEWGAGQRGCGCNAKGSRALPRSLDRGHSPGQWLWPGRAFPRLHTHRLSIPPQHSEHSLPCLPSRSIQPASAEPALGGCLGRSRVHCAWGCLAWEAMGVSKQNESTAIQVLHVFTETRSAAQAARPGEVH